MLMEHAAGCVLPDWETLLPACQVHRFAKGSDVFAAGQWQPYVYVLRSGIVKLTYLSEAGQEWIKSFIGAGDFFACPNVLIAGLKTDYFATAIEDCEIEQVDYAAVKLLIERYPAWQTAIRHLLSAHIVRKEQRERELLTMAPEARYLSFLHSYPHMAARIQLRDLAHYLGVTPEALSRIRKRLQM
ncbi:MULTISPECIES: Crp/Fnr family transcriptional regulator [unclassified Undibacterium]|uniref:Crp/Fnr family transcriptional regulator n=1 Tax=unclassified Undibacterium TaxID=2630295 RepID=UPI002AC8B2A7|nr:MULTISPECIES: Crp/Fnr family transcriptional regulator [unclassified Undibacterium]MEB0137588.1 Crp/Fnr family transcriptional regulator [Undibacterium sp. CCC2.1]MEB0170589.1 Crp/Fnr family transcriptional regulator [Undibacterium sp. CCC1.1]MEB0174530.1 Crp/Fnr family transcriptional regulator [Undibacterium sp. CCC3.4]MEB0213673.1 Crp/Fnr family transcriptional regulator [Undibacterium sp. 5I2]WPX43839.1 Crp/Fnr family transcriptional regulator [Undibacterium sp. CCC3.4]